MVPTAIETSNTTLLIQIGVLLPPAALCEFGEFLDERVVETPYGRVGPLALRGERGGSASWIQPYSGLPSRTDPRATLFAARTLGVTAILGWDRARSLNPALQLGQSCFVEDYIDGTRHQPPTFLTADGGVDLPADIDNALREVSTTIGPHYDAGIVSLLKSKFSHHELSLPGIVYLGLDGPRRETLAEAHVYRLWNADVVGHNLIPEVFLAQELALSYTGVVTVTSLGSNRIRAQHSLSDTTMIVAGMERTARILAQLTTSTKFDGEAQ